MDCFVHETPLDHSFQKERRSLASKGSLGKRRRPSRYDIRSNVSGLSDSFNLDCEKEPQKISDDCTIRSSEIKSNHDDSSLSVTKATKDQVKRKPESSRSAVLIQTWERRSQTEKTQKLQSNLPCSRDSKPFYNVAVASEKESHLKLPLQEQRMLESPVVRNYCESRFHHDTSKEKRSYVNGDCSSKDHRKWRSESDFKSRSSRTTEVTGKINDEPEWISLSKKLCAKFVESHLEYNNGDVTKDHQDVSHVTCVKSKVEQDVPDTSKKTESSASKEPQWVLLSKKLCTKFLEEHIENCKENSSPAQVEKVQRQAVITEKFHKTSTNCSGQQKEPEWISLSRKLRAKFIEGHLDDPDKVSFDSQLNASDLEEGFSVPTLAQKYLDYKNQAHTSYQFAVVTQDGSSSQNLLRECSTENQETDSLTGKNKELSRSMPDMLMKSQLPSEEFIWRDKGSLTHCSDLEHDLNATKSDTVSNKEVLRVNVDYGGCYEHKRSCDKSPTYTNFSASVANHKYGSSTENHRYGDLCFVDKRCSAKLFYDSEDSVSANDTEAKNFVHSFCSSPDNDSRKQVHQNMSISLDNSDFQMRRNSPTRASEDIPVCSPFGDNRYFKQCYSDDDTFHTVDLNSNSESIDSVEIKKTNVNDQRCEFSECNSCNITSNSREKNVFRSDYFGRNSNTIVFDNPASFPIKNVINSQECNEFQDFGYSKELQHNHLMACDMFANSAHDEEEHVKNNDKLWLHQNENERRQVYHAQLCDNVEGPNNESLLSSTAKFSCQTTGGISNATEFVDKRESDVELCEAEVRSSHDVHNKNQRLASEIKLQKECPSQFAVQNSSILNKSESKGSTKRSHSNCRNKNNEFIAKIEKRQITENSRSEVASDTLEESSKLSNEIKTSVNDEDLTMSKNDDHLDEAASDGNNHQKVIVSFNVKPHEPKSTSDNPRVHVSKSFRDETNNLSCNINKMVENQNTNQISDHSNHLSKVQKEPHHSKTNTSKVFKYCNFEKPALKESAIFYRLCENETLENGQESESRANVSKRTSSVSLYPDEKTKITKHGAESDVDSGLLDHSSCHPVTSEDISFEMIEEIRLKSSEKQRDIKTRLRPLGYLSKISNSNHLTNPSERSEPKRTDSTKSHYIDYKDKHLYMNYNQEYGKIRSKDAYHQNKCHASAPDLSKDMKKDDTKQENSHISKAESQQEIKIEKTAREVLSLDCIIKMAPSPGLNELPGPPESASMNRVVNSKESFSQTSPLLSAKRHIGEGGFCTFDDQDYLKDSTSTSFCPSDSECSSWIMTRNNSYIINESSSMNESDISDCSLSVKCDYLSSCSNQNTMETRGGSSSESGSYVQMQNFSKVKNSLQNTVEKSENATMSSEARDDTKMRKLSCPATPESLRHLFQLPTKPLFPPTLHTSRVFISKDPPPIYASLAQSSSSLKQNKNEDRGRKTDRSSSLKIRDIAQGIILTFRRFQNISSTKHRHVSPSRYVDVSHLAESNRKVPKEWFSGGNNPSLNFLNGTSKKPGTHSIFSTGRPVRSQSESSGCPVNFRRQQNMNSRAEKISLGKASCSRSSSSVSNQHERTRNGNTLESNSGLERFKTGDKVSDRRAKKSNKTRSQQNSSKGRTAKVPESRNVTSISRKVQQMADGTLYLVTTVSGDSSVPGFYSDSVNTNEENSSCGQQTKAAGESNC